MVLKLQKRTNMTNNIQNQDTEIRPNQMDKNTKRNISNLLEWNNRKVNLNVIWP